MTEYLLYFNQQWVGDHSEEWFRPRGPLAMAVVNEMKAAGVYVFAGGLEEEDGPVYSVDPTSGTVMITDGPYVETKEFWAGSPWWTWPTTRPPRCGRARSRRHAAGHMRFAASSRSLGRVGGDMTEYLIAFNDEWVPDYTDEEFREKATAVGRKRCDASGSPCSSR
jgi:hypothetical protein